MCTYISLPFTVHVQRNPSNTSSPRPAADEPTPQSGAAPQPSAPPQATIFSGMFPGSFGMTPPTAGGQAGPQPQFSEMLRDVLRSSSGEVRSHRIKAVTSLWCDLNMYAALHGNPS